MAHEQIKGAALPRAFAEVLADVADLIQKEIRLARAEISDRLSTKIAGGVWMAAAGVLGLVAILLLLEAIVFGIASLGLALHWSCLIVAAAIAIIAAIAFAKGRADVRSDMTPRRTIRSLERDISVAKEQVT
jgi:Putative Actinobacterial Holin-X, holin superfamily III